MIQHDHLEYVGISDLLLYFCPFPSSKREQTEDSLAAASDFYLGTNRHKLARLVLFRFLFVPLPYKTRKPEEEKKKKKLPKNCINVTETKLVAGKRYPM